MVARKAGLPELGMQPSIPAQAGASLPLDKQVNQSTGNSADDQVGNRITAELLERIHESNSRLDRVRSKARVTVVIPAYLKDLQDLRWLYEALESVFNQTEPCQVILVENGSNFLPDL